MAKKRRQHAEHMYLSYGLKALGVIFLLFAGLSFFTLMKWVTLGDTSIIVSFSDAITTAVKGILIALFGFFFLFYQPKSKKVK